MVGIQLWSSRKSIWILHLGWLKRMLLRASNCLPCSLADNHLHMNTPLIPSLQHRTGRPSTRSDRHTRITVSARGQCIESRSKNGGPSIASSVFLRSWCTDNGMVRGRRNGRSVNRRRLWNNHTKGSILIHLMKGFQEARCRNCGSCSQSSRGHGGRR
jgi:hypothetical protein